MLARRRRGRATPCLTANGATRPYLVCVRPMVWFVRGLVGWKYLSMCGLVGWSRLSVWWVGGLEPPLRVWNRFWRGWLGTGLGLGTWAACKSASAPTPVHTCCRPARGAGRPWRGRRGCPSVAAAMRASGDRRRQAGRVSRATAMPQLARRASRAGTARAPSRPAAPGEEQHRAGRAWAIALIADAVSVTDSAAGAVGARNSGRRPRRRELFYNVY